MLVEAEALLRCQVRWDYPDDDDSDELDAAALQELGCKCLDDPEAEGAKEHSTQASQNSGSGNRDSDVEGSESSSSDPEASRELLTERLLGSLDGSAEGSRRNTRNDPAYLELEAKQLRFSLPPKEAVDKILRYETAIGRQLYRAMNQLERLQRRRLGDIAPPPISVELSTQ